MSETRLWSHEEWIRQTQLLIDSWEIHLGRPLIDRNTPIEDSRSLFEAGFVVVSHGTEADPILNYANNAALKLWETDATTLLSMPSRKTAEPMHRDERAELLKRTREHGYIDDYSGIRISATGKRFRIKDAIVWNLRSVTGEYAGQAATFSEWEFLS